MAYTQNQLDALNEAIVSGHLRVTYDGKTVEYRSLEDMIRIRDMIANQLGQGSTAAERRVTPAFSKGLK